MTKDFSNILQEHRERAGLTQGELARYVNVSQQSVAKWESGKAFPRAKVFRELVEVLKIDERLLTGNSLAAAIGRKRLGVVSAQPEFPLLNSYTASKGHAGEVESLDVIDPPKRFPEMERSIGYREKFLGHIGPLLRDMDESSRWDGTVSSKRGGSWRIDYDNSNVVANFLYPQDAMQFSRQLQVFARVQLWNMSTLRAYDADHRSYMLIFILPAEVDDLEEDAKLPEQYGGRATESQLHKLIFEASLMDISVFTARNPRELMSLIKSADSLDDLSA